MATVYKANDTRPVLELALTEDGQPLDLTDVTTAKFIMSQNGTPNEIDADIQTPASAGILHVEFTGADTDTPGTYEAEVELTYSDGGIETVPNSGHMALTIEPDLA